MDAQPNPNDQLATTADPVAEIAEANAPLTAAAPVIGIFDSGVGGFTVAGAILKRRPDLSLVYYADSLNLPYGGRDPEQLRRFADHTIEFLKDHGAELLATGCNASNSAVGADGLAAHGLPVFDLVGSTIAKLRASNNRPAHIAVLATEATVRTGYWDAQLREAFPDMLVSSVAAPQLVPLIEASQPDPQALRRAIDGYLTQVREAGADTVLLGCTHYPLVQKEMVEADALLSFIDPAQALAEQLAAALPPAEEGAPAGRLRFFNSLPSERFYALGERAFGRSIRELTQMYIVNPYED